MSKSAGYILGIVIVICVGAILQYFLCCGPGLAFDRSGESVLGARAGMPFELVDPSGRFSVKTAHNFDFPVSSYSFLTPVSPELEDGIDQLKTFLAQDSSVKLSLTGFAYESEVNQSAFPTLGEARANSVRSALIDRGIAGSQITVSGSMFDGLISSGDSIVTGPISYLLSVPDDETATDTGLSDSGGDGSGNKSNDFAALIDELNTNPMTLYFEVGSAFVNLSPSERQLISRLNQYIGQNDQATIIITGHTDDSGSPQVNEQLGKERAEFLKSYLVRNGFRSDRIKTISQGESQPIASNDTPQGKAENRRAVLTIEN